MKDDGGQVAFRLAATGVRWFLTTALMAAQKRRSLCAFAHNHRRSVQDST